MGTSKLKDGVRDSVRIDQDRLCTDYQGLGAIRKKNARAKAPNAMKFAASCSCELHLAPSEIALKALQSLEHRSDSRHRLQLPCLSSSLRWTRYVCAQQVSWSWGPARPEALPTVAHESWDQGKVISCSSAPLEACLRQHPHQRPGGDSFRSGSGNGQNRGCCAMWALRGHRFHASSALSRIRNQGPVLRWRLEVHSEGRDRSWQWRCMYRLRRRRGSDE